MAVSKTRLMINVLLYLSPSLHVFCGSMEFRVQTAEFSSLIAAFFRSRLGFKR